MKATRQFRLVVLTTVIFAGSVSAQMQDQVQQDPMLQKHLIGPLAVDGSELLLRLNSVVIDVEKLTLFASLFYSGEPGRGIRGATGCRAGVSR
jgi:hypothetical protein